MSYRVHVARLVPWTLALMMAAAVGAPGVGQAVDEFMLVPSAEITGAPDGTGHQVGDVNCDGLVNFEDINPFVLTLTDPEGYHASFPNCDILEADFNCDNVVNFYDINAFVDWMGCLECGPEPGYCSSP